MYLIMVVDAWRITNKLAACGIITIFQQKLQIMQNSVIIWDTKQAFLNERKGCMYMAFLVPRTLVFYYACVYSCGSCYIIGSNRQFWWNYVYEYVGVIEMLQNVSRVFLPGVLMFVKCVIQNLMPLSTCCERSGY
jgi:hypothetical protein